MRISWYECPKCGRELDENQAYHGECKYCGPVVVHVGRGTPGEPIDLNRATALELERIAGFGKAAARYIVAKRRDRKFTSVEELLKVRGIGKVKYEALKGRVFVR